MKIVICSSMSFAKQILEIKQKLESLNHIVEIPKNTEKYVNGTIKIENKLEKMKLDAIKKYFEKIKTTDAVLIINLDKNNIKNYLGGNSLIEMAFAHVLNKKIFLLNDIPNMNYSDEIEAMKPTIINGNLELIK